MPYSAQGEALTTSNGLVFTTDLSGRVYALDAKTGKELWHDDAGASVAAPLAAYQASDGDEYVIVMAGEAGNQQTPNLPKLGKARVVAYRLNATQTTQNDTTGQTVPATVHTTASFTRTRSVSSPLRFMSRSKFAGCFGACARRTGPCAFAFERLSDVRYRPASNAAQRSRLALSRQLRGHYGVPSQARVRTACRRKSTLPKYERAGARENDRRRADLPVTV